MRRSSVRLKGTLTRASLSEHADVAQLVEHHLAKVGVAGSNPVVRSDRTAASCGRSARQGCLISTGRDGAMT
jgi:hypothetical protein